LVRGAIEANDDYVRSMRGFAQQLSERYLAGVDDRPEMARTGLGLSLKQGISRSSKRARLIHALLHLFQQSQ
jgi:hypothetical protein